LDAIGHDVRDWQPAAFWGGQFWNLISISVFDTTFRACFTLLDTAKSIYG
jgi:hypothetical protein